MALNYVVGDIVGHQREEHVEWKISDYFSQPQKADTSFESPPFYCFGSTWCLLFYPNGVRSRQNIGTIEIYLKVQNSIPCYPITFSLGIKDIPYHIQKGPFTHTFTFSELNPSIGFPNVIRRNDLIRTMKEDPSRSTLTVYCNISANLSSVKDAACQTLLDSTTHLCRDFKDLLQSERNSDFTIEVLDHVFRVHKLILGARSSVFATMFEHTTTEKMDSILKMDDCDPDGFHDFLQYIYTGNVENLSWDNVIHLFSIADKFCVKELRKQCKEFMTENMTVENACDALPVLNTICNSTTSFADMHLCVHAMLLLTQNIRTFKKTDKWLLFMEKHPSIAANILMLCIPDEHSSAGKECCIL